MKRGLGVLAVFATCAVIGITASVALAIPLSNPGEAANCSTTSGTWHFVHNQTSTQAGILTVKFEGADAFPVSDTPSPSPNLHYRFTYAGTLESASDNVAGGRLNLSDCPQPPPPVPVPVPPL